MKSILPLLFITIFLALTYNSFKQVRWSSRQDELAASACDLIQLRAEVGDLYGAVAEAEHLFREYPEGQRARVALNENGINHGLAASGSAAGLYRNLVCAVIGKPESAMQFKFIVRDFWNRNLLLYFAVSLIAILTAFFFFSFFVSRMVRTLSDIIATALAQELEISDRHVVNNAVSMKVMRSLLKRFVDDFKPQIESLKLAASEKSWLELEANRSKEFLGTIKQLNHDIGGTLSGLRILHGELDGNADQSRRAGNLIGRLSTLLGDLENHEGMEPVTESLSEMLPVVAVAEIIEEKQFIAPNVKFEISFNHDQLTSVFVNSVHFRRVISNILQNAIEALHNSGVIAVEIVKQNEYAIIKITDSGIGMSREVIEDIFTLGFTKGKAKGSGLGLKHARACIERWGGFMKVESDEGIGTAISIGLPLIETACQFVGPNFLKDHKQVVAIDDEPEFIRIMPAFELNARFLKPREFVEWFQHEADPDKHLISVDYHLNEGFDGLDILKQIPNDFSRVLTTSDYESIQARAVAARLGFAILPKPLLRWI